MCKFGKITKLLVFCCLIESVKCMADRDADDEDRVMLAFDNLDTFYMNGTGFYNGMEDWHNANILEQTANWIALGTGGNETEKKMRLYVIEQMYEIQIVNKTCDGNMYNDDVLWFVLAWFRVYEVLDDVRFLNRSIDLYDCVLYAWDDICGGGIYWNYWRIYKNAVTNSLFVIASHKLNKTEWYDKAYNWWLSSGMLGRNYLVYDGLNQSCENNRHTVWTYNMGLSVGFLNGDIGNKVMNNAVGYFDIFGDGVLTELCEVDSNKCIPACPVCNNDQKQFKGIFIRYLGYRKLNGYNIIVKNNLRMVLEVYNENWYGLSWTRQVGSIGVNYVTQSSVIDLLLVSRELGLL